MFKKIEAVFFDLDGTLIDSMWMWKQIDIEYLGRYGIELPDGLQKAIEGMAFSETAVYFKNRFNIPDSLDKIKNDWNHMAWEMYEKRVPLKEGALEFLKFIKNKNIKTCIATSNSRELAELVINKHAVNKYFDSIITCCDVKSGKPAPDVYLKCADAVSVNPKNCLVIEDIPKGLMAGRAAGMKTIAIEDIYSDDVKEEKINLSDMYITNYRQLIDIWNKSSGVMSSEK
ncbi:MAG: HAD family hydrolase [Eubacterium sp.]